MDAAALAATIDHTLLDPLATSKGIEQLCREAADWGIGHVCVSPTRVALAVELLRSTAVGVCSVVGFPSGAHLPASKAAEAAVVAELGAAEVDMVVALGAVAEGDWGAVRDDVAAVVGAVGPRVPVKAILESGAFAADPSAVRAAARAAIDAGAAFVKTSTGYHPGGGATVDAVALLHEVAAGRAEVKASGGIRTLEDARALLAAGASRLGTSRSVQLLSEARRA